jgi:cobalt-zinc-cadmium efflux system outer membrane protein
VESFAIEHRLDLKAARAEVETASAALSITKGTRFINAVNVGGHIDKDPESVTFAGPNVELQIPIFDQGQAAVARLRAQLRQAQKLMDARAIEIRSEVRAARTRLQATRAAADYYRTTLLPIRERIVLLSQQQYNAMLLGVYQLLQAKQAEVNAYREYIEAVRDYWIARSDLERAAGGPMP